MPNETKQIAMFDRISVPLFKGPGEGKTWAEMFKIDTNLDGVSSQQISTGRKTHPFDFRVVTEFQSSNEYHATCVKTKTAATVGLGFRTPEDEKNKGLPLIERDKSFVESKADIALNPLCQNTFQDVLNDVCEDFWQVGNGYMEVVRRGTDKIDGEITGIHHIPASDVAVYLENLQYDRHFEIQGLEGGSVRRFARFGDKQAMIKRLAGGSVALIGGGSVDENAVSEVIHFRQPSSLSRWYGFPDWLSAVALIELMQMILQYRFDFFNNRGVPEFMLFITGGKVAAPLWDEIVAAVKANIGKGNSHKSMAVNLETPEIKIQLEKLGMEQTGEANEFATSNENLAMRIVSAHRVPPLLAGILIPGKLGATNELPNALMAFQSLVIGQTQRLFQQTLGATLGNKTLNSKLALAVKDFTFKTILDEIDIGVLDTQSRMRETTTEAKAKGRDLGAGVKD